MEANEVQELHEQHERASEGAEHEAHGKTLRPVSFTMSVLAVLVAIVTVMGHRTHTDAVLMQARASDQWSLYQAKKIRQNDTQIAEDLLGALAVRDNTRAQGVVSSYQAHRAKWAGDLAQEEATAQRFEEDVTVAEKRADRFDLGEALLEIALVVTSITLLTRQRAYWVLGMIFGAIGIIVAALGFSVHG